VNVRFWGVRGSLPAAQPEMAAYGGNTSCVELCGADARHVVALDAGTGICALGTQMAASVERVDVLLTHLHMDHILGLGFFEALFRPDLEVHIWGPSSATSDLRGRLARYLSPPLFPVRLRDLPCDLTLHDVPLGSFDIPGWSVRAALICHPGLTVGYRLEDDSGSLAYLPDHEPALGVRRFPERPEWTSGYDLARGVGMLIHDAQYDDDEYQARVGWGHSRVEDAARFATLTEVGRLVAFHHDPRHDDKTLDAWYGRDGDAVIDGAPIHAAREGDILAVTRT
jgi:phosphoribosyl 1,2-cyclic phosphodiesterase